MGASARMALTEREKRALKEKYKEHRRSTWGIRTRRKGLPENLEEDPTDRTAEESQPVAILRRSEDRAEPIASPRKPSQSTDADEPSDTVLPSVEEPRPVQEPLPVRLTPPATSEAEVVHSKTDVPRRPAPTPGPDRDVPPQQTDTQQQLREKIKQQRRDTWAGERSAPRLNKPAKRKTDKGEREFWSESPQAEAEASPKKGVSIGAALLITIACTGVVALGVLLGYLLTIL